jgi:RNA recognition motif. (a.k.a. RRM, RBD, or RNP domain)
VDVLCFAWERASRGAKACVVLITSDGDYSYALARLRDIGVFTVIFYRPDIVAKVLIDNANVVMSWEFDVLGGPPRVEEEEQHGQVQDDKSTVARSLPNDSGGQGQTTDSDAKESDCVVVKQPTPHNVGKFALFFSVVLNAQHRRVQEGISVYSSWADEGGIASTFYAKVGEKDREGYFQIRSTATQKGFIEWGRRNLSAPEKPVIKVKDREESVDGLSSETYLRLTYSGLAVLKPNVAAKENDWTMVLPKGNAKQLHETASTSSNQTPTKTKNGKLFVGGLAWQTTADSLRSYFKQFGPLEHVHVMEGKGFGFVFFKFHHDAEKALEKAVQHFVDKKSVE